MTDAEKFAYQYTQAEDGTYTVNDVEIFELGKHRGFEFDDSWAQRAINWFQRMKTERSWLPPIIIGHNPDDPDAPEKPSVGTFDNLRHVGKMLVADMVGLGEDVFNDLRQRKYQNRSVEVHDKSAMITALALLGGTEPYHKLPLLQFGNEQGEWVTFGVPDEPKDENAMSEKEIMPIPGETLVPGVTQESLDALRAELTEKFQSDIEAANTRADAAEEAATTFERGIKEERRLERVARLNADLRETYSIAPAVIDHPATLRVIDMLSRDEEVVKFKDGDKEGAVSGVDVVRVLFHAISEHRDTLFVDRSERGGIEEGAGDKPTDLRITELARKYRAEGVDNVAAVTRAKREINEEGGA